MNTEFLSRKTCTVVNGIFIIMVFFAHVWQYIAPALGQNWTILDNLYAIVTRWSGQYIVVSFLLFSGYGVTTSILEKGAAYAKKIPSARILPTLLNFDIAVCIFIAVNLILGFRPSLAQCLLSLSGWDSVGNSNWYIFCILWCYCFSFVASLCSKHSKEAHLMIVLVLCLLYIVLLSVFKGNQRWWYDTILAYPTGVAIALYRDKLSLIIEKWRWPLVLGLMTLFLFLLYAGRMWAPGYNIIGSVVFALMLVVLFYRVNLNSRILNWCGSHLFVLYIYQRLPMLVLATLFPTFVSCHQYLYMFVCATITIILAILTKPMCDKISKLCKAI